MDSDGAPQASRTVLVVDDDAGVRGVACLSLETSGYEILSADSGNSALDVLRGHTGPLHLVVLDANMPGLKTAETLRELQKMRGDVPILLMSGDDERDVYMEIGMADPPQRFLSKPFTPTALREAVKAAL